MWPLRALFVALLQQIVVIAIFDSGCNEYLVAPEGDSCRAQLTCYHLSALLEHGSDWYSDTVIAFLPGNYTLSQPWVIAKPIMGTRNNGDSVQSLFAKEKLD